MGVLSNILEYAPGVAAQGYAGYAQGEERQRQRELQRERELRERMYEQALLDLRKRREERLSQQGPGGSAGYDPTTDPQTQREEYFREKGLGRYYDDPADEPTMTPGQQATANERQRERTHEEALGQAMTWVRAELNPQAFAGGARGRAPELDRNTIINLIKTNYGLPVGEAGRIYEQALSAVRNTQNRESIIENREAGGGGAADLLAGLGVEGAEPAPAPSRGGGPALPGGKQPAYATEPSDTGAAYQPDQPEDVDPAFVNQVQQDLQSGKSPDAIIQQIRQAGVPESYVKWAEKFLGVEPQGEDVSFNAQPSDPGTRSRTRNLAASERAARERIGWGGSGMG